MIVLANKINLTGHKFNHLLVIKEIPKEERKNKNKVEWLCQCDCGNFTTVISNYLTSGHTKSCGCLRAENAKKLFTIDITGQQFERLTALEPTEQRGADGSIIWKCKCSCGKTHYASTNSLRTGAISSCGCWRSKGETKINNILFENNVSYKTQFKFNDLRDQKPLHFDFAIFNNNDELHCLLEYQGVQHYDPNSLHGAWKNTPQQHDEMKRAYCKKNNIKLIEIPYTDFELIDWEYLKNKLSL